MDQGIYWYLLGTAAAVLTTFGFVPQIIKMHRTKSARDISAVTLLQFTAGTILWAFYGYHIRDIIVISANIISFIIMIVAIILYNFYSRK
ncbi:MAG: SemiSWEET family transporter [Candidatus Methanoperedens sp.]|nr:SemiSWEET family transporter [Candidatus Methanoperedens sp.]